MVPFAELKEMASVGKLVADLAKRGNALLAPRAAPAKGEANCGGTPGGSAEKLIKPSAMRVEYKVRDKKTGVTQRVQLTPQSTLAELEHAESILVKPHDV